MNLANLTLVTAIFLNLIYLGLAIAAYQHMKPDSRASEVTRLLAFTLWWPFYGTYEKSAKPFRIFGAAVLLACVVAYVAWVKVS